jgi:AraC family transcriptional activator of mtrCDE
MTIYGRTMLESLSLLALRPNSSIQTPTMNPTSQIPDDALTRLLDRVRIDAKLFKHRDYCGQWAIDTSGTGLVPFHLIERGTGWLHVAGEPPQLLQAGDFVLFPRDVPQVISGESVPPETRAFDLASTGDNDHNFASILCGFYAFRSDAVAALLNDLPAIVLVKDARRNAATASIGCVIDAALVELDHDYPGRSAALRDLARLLFLNVLRDRIARGLSGQFLAALGDPQIGKALSLMHADFGRDLSLEALSRHAGMSRSAFADKFRTLVGTTPAKYLTAWRMQEAASLLQESRLSVEQIAEACGYGSHVAFRKAFKATQGMTPNQVRKSAGKSG